MGKLKMGSGSKKLKIVEEERLVSSEEEEIESESKGKMGLGSKKLKIVEEERLVSSEEEEIESESKGEMRLGSDQFESDDDAMNYDEESGSGLEDDGDEDDDEMEEENGGGKFEGAKYAEMEELEKELHDIQNREQDLLKNLMRSKDEDAIKGQAVKNQKALWDKTLEFRFLLQKAFSSSNKLPQWPIKSSFCSSDEVVDRAYSDLDISCKQTLDSMLELQDALLEQNHSIIQGTVGNSKESHQDGDLSNDTDDEWLMIHKAHSRLAPFRNNSVDKWHRKAQVNTGAAAFKGKLHAFNKDTSEQVAAYMRDPSRMIKRMQLRRSSVGVLGNVSEDSESTKEDGNMEGDPELLDDSEFYQQLLKEFFESCDLSSSETALYALKKLQPKKRKIVDRRASKSRKIRYNVHEKLVNFMAPLPMDLPPMAPKLFENVFGMGKQKT